MFFKNLSLFRFPRSLAWIALEAGANECQLKPVGPLELTSRGFVPFYGEGEELTVSSPGVIFLTIGGEDKILPSSAVNAELKKRLAVIEEREGRKPGGATRKRIKDDLFHEMLPKALVKPMRVNAMILVNQGWLVVDTSSRKVAENVASEIRRALGSFPALPVNAERSPRAVLTEWLATNAAPDGLALGGDAVMKDAVDGGAKVTLVNQDLAGEEVAKHLESGKQATRLGLTLDDHLSFTLDEDLTVRKLKFLDGAVDSLENTEREDLRAEIDARCHLIKAEVGQLLGVLELHLKLSPPQ